MAIELPSEVYGAAVGVLVYSFLALFCNGMVVWLTWTHRERTSYVALIGYTIFLSTTANIASQIHFYIDFNWWMTAMWEAATANPNDPQIIISNGAVGIDLGLWYFRQYTYSIGSMLVLFWAFALLQAVYGWAAEPHLKVFLNRVNAVGKGVSITLPILPICLLQFKAIQSSLGAFMFLANVILMISLAGGCFLTAAILIRYIQSRRQLIAWNVRYDNAQSTESIRSAAPRNSRSHRKERCGIYDQWLITRFTIAFVVLSVFQLTNMLFQFAGMSNNHRDASAPAPDLSVDRAKQTTVLWMPGPAPSFLLFIVFGTTAPFRRYMYATFVPKRWRRMPEKTMQNESIIPSAKFSTVSTDRSRSTIVSSASNIEQDLRRNDMGKGQINHPMSNSDDTLSMLPIVRPTYSYKIEAGRMTR
ncbi:hypothetical protein BJ170DRAFT_307871 [Xylariales sp. AK1849]|nr:hypothetical protein BJ170DRAFT_307871 [Xylariales sp. AK1849]